MGKAYIGEENDNPTVKRRKIKEIEKRKPPIDKIGCYFSTGENKSGFEFFKNVQITNGDIFVFNKGILWKLR